MTNSVVLIGRITKTPELRKTKNSAPVTSFNIAVQRYKSDVDYIDCVCYRALADNLCKYIKKGNL